jgi:N-acetylglucosamine-6-sulfatase
MSAVTFGGLTGADGAVAPRPNIVYVVTDDQTYESLAMGMPKLSSGPYGSWVSFSDAVVNVSNCCPSRSTFFTGQIADHHGVIGNGFGASFDDTNALPIWLQNAGYHTTLIGKYLNGYPWHHAASYIPPGWNRWFVYNPRDSDPSSEGYVVNDQGLSVTYGTGTKDYSTDVFRDKALEVVRSAPEPFFLEMATLAPHRPFRRADRHRNVYAGAPVPVPPSFDEADVSDKPAWVRALEPLTARQRERMHTDRRKAWEALLAVDEAVTAILDKLAASGRLDRTVVAVTSDNNLSFGEHRWRESKNCAYESCVHVPLLIRYPGAVARTVPDVVGNVDLAPTFVELAGATSGRAFDGSSLVPLLEGTGGRPDEILLEKPRGSGSGGDSSPGDPGGSDAGGPVTPFYGVRTARWKYVEHRTGERELYDLDADPDELQNLYGTPGREAVTADLAARLARLRA